MELSWSTFILEIINFLVLVWILKRFLYKPVLDVIARRQAGVEKTLTDAKALQTEAEKLKEQYENRLANWERERQQARESLIQALESERVSKMKELQTSLEHEREKSRVAEARRQTDAIHKIEETALLQAARFASRLLKAAAGPETQTRLVELATAELAGLPAETVADLRGGYVEKLEEIVVASAFPLTKGQRQQLGQALKRVVGPNIPLRFEQNGELLAGVRITIDAWVLSANLLDELKGFAELSHDEKRIRHGHQPT